MRSLRIAAAGITAFVALLTLLFSLGQASEVQAQTDEAGQITAVSSAAEWLVVTHQNEDGGYTAFSTGAENAPSDVGGTVDAVLALGSSGHSVAAPFPGHENTPITYLSENPDALAAYAAQGGGQAGKLALALVAAGQNPRTFAGHNFVISLTQHLSPTGEYNAASPFEHSLAMLAQAAVSGTVPVSATEWLVAQQATEGDLAGSWDDGFGTDGNVDGTAMALMALLAAGEGADSAAVSQAREFLTASQLESGGWGYAPEEPESANSTALAVQALSALGEDFYSEASPLAQDGVSPLAALLNWQSESGAFQADFGDGPFDDFFTTVQALPAAAGRAFPPPARHEAARQAIACLAALQDDGSGGWAEFAGTEPNAGGTARAIQALAAVGEDVTAAPWQQDGSGPVEALIDLTPAYLAQGRGGRVGIVMQGLAAAPAADVQADDVGGLNLVISMTEYLSPTGEYADTSFGPFGHAEAMLGLASIGEPVDSTAVEWLLAAHEDGDWGGPDATGISLQALAASGELPDDVREMALEQLQEQQLADGGWGMEAPSSPNSTSEVAQGLAAAGQNPFDPAWSRVMSGTLQNAADVVLAQQADNGCWPNLFGPGDDPYGTTDAMLLLMLTPEWGAVAPQADDAQQEATATATLTAEATATEEPAAADEPAATDEPTETALPPTETVAEPTAEATATPPSPAEGSDDADVEAPPAQETGGVNWVLIAVIAVVLVAGAVLFIRRQG
ncbi:MAG: prenyltransferase/squalene oxidase repeat-containing protein [Chloroflexota bacterium]